MADDNNNNPGADDSHTDPLTFSKDYVESLRRESASYRTRAIAAEKAARDAFGLKQDEDIGDLSARLSERESQALERANDRLIDAEIKGLAGYNTALLERLIDRGGIQVGEDGTVTGAKEAAEAAAKQFPEVLAQPERAPYAPPNPGAGDPPPKDIKEMTYDELAAYMAANPSSKI